MAMKYSYDEKCWELAEYFAPDKATSEQTRGLAQHIQDSVEDWLQNALVPVEQPKEKV